MFLWNRDELNQKRAGRVADRSETRKSLLRTLEDYILCNYLEENTEEDSSPSPSISQKLSASSTYGRSAGPASFRMESAQALPKDAPSEKKSASPFHGLSSSKKESVQILTDDDFSEEDSAPVCSSVFSPEDDEAIQELQDRLSQRMTHMSDTFAQYLLYLIRLKGLKNADVYKDAAVDKKVFSKIKNNPDYHPQKLTALCLCLGAHLSLDETRDLLARAGYALSPCDKTDIIFSFFIENQIYDIIEVDIQLEEHGQPVIIQ